MFVCCMLTCVKQEANDLHSYIANSYRNALTYPVPPPAWLSSAAKNKLPKLFTYE